MPYYFSYKLRCSSIKYFSYRSNSPNFDSLYETYLLSLANSACSRIISSCKII